MLSKYYSALIDLTKFKKIHFFEKKILGNKKK